MSLAVTTKLKPSAVHKRRSLLVRFEYLPSSENLINMQLVLERQTFVEVWINIS